MEQSISKLNSSTFSFKENIIFILKLFLFSLITIIFYNHIMPQYSGSYNASLIDKVARLRTIKEPKIVLLGNSNLAFGIDSSLIEKELGMPVVNMGLHGGIGNVFHEEMARFNVTKGDIYILCHSSFADGDSIGNPELAWITIENNWRLWHIPRVKDWPRMLRAFPTYLKKSINLYSAQTGNKDTRGVYSRSAFNSYGDISVNLPNNTWKYEANINIPPINNIAVDRINKLNAWLVKRGATLVIASYPVRNNYRTVDAQDFVSFQEKLKRELDCPIISNYIDYMYDYHYFSNAILHLTTEGANIRTNQLINDIKRWKISEKEAELNGNSDLITDCNLSHISDFMQYFNALMNGMMRYCIFFSVKDDASSGMNDDHIDILNKLGLHHFPKQFGLSYYAVITNGKISEYASNKSIKTNGYIDADNSFEVTSAGHDCGNVSSILINGNEASNNQRGINIVVYSTTLNRIIDRVTFDTHSPNLTAFRQL